MCRSRVTEDYFLMNFKFRSDSILWHLDKNMTDTLINVISLIQNHNQSNHNINCKGKQKLYQGNINQLWVACF